MTQMQTHQQIVNRQRLHMNNDYLNPKRKDLHESWFKENTVDFWRHERMYETIRPVAEQCQTKKWLTIGDGRYGLDAYRLKNMYNLNVLPTDISQNMLARGKQLGLIHEYAIENAENLSFDDNSFDIVFCKESFHHFPRPMIALYEMIRVCKYAVILIEPNDFYVLNRPGPMAKLSVKWLLSRLLSDKLSPNSNLSCFSGKPHTFEKSGNYVYSLSKRELEKIVRALSLEAFAWIGLNDYYVEGCEFEKAEPNNHTYKLAKKNIEKMNKKCRWLPLFYDYNLITTAIFSAKIDSELKQKMIAFGYKFSNITPNPYI